MKRVYKNWLTRLLLFIGATFSIRLIATALHMTTLDKLYKPRDFRKTSRLEISDAVLTQLPRHCQTITGQRMDPINLLLVGTEAGIRRSFEKAGWSTAHPFSPLHLVAGLASTILNRSYQKGPFTPLFINIGLQDLAFQKTTERRSFRQRHHVRIWRTKYELPGGNRLWVAAASFDTALRVSYLPPFIHHHIDPQLDTERDLIASDLLASGCKMIDEYQLHNESARSKPHRNAHFAAYYTDGFAKAIEVE